MSGRRQTNKSAVENLVFAGAFDNLHKNRSAVYETLPAALGENANTGAGLFGEEVNALADVPPWREHVILEHEQKALGFPLSGSFYGLHKTFLRDLRIEKLSEVSEDGFRTAGVLSAISSPRALRQHGIRILILEDDEKTNFEVTASSGILDGLGKLKEGQDVLIVEGALRGRRLRASSLWTIDGYIGRCARKIVIHCNDMTPADKILDMLSPARDATGDCAIQLSYKDEKLSCVISLGSNWRPSKLLYDSLLEYAIDVRVEYRTVNA